MTVLRPNNDIFFQYLSHIFNECIETAGFPNELKLANINPVCKKNDRLRKENYRPVIVLSIMSKIFERCLFDQIFKNVNILSRNQVGYGKSYNSQHSLISMFLKWRGNRDKGGTCGALFVDSSKAINCLRDLLLTKLNAYRLGYKSIKLISSFVSSRKYRTKNNSSFSNLKHLLEYHKDQS